MKINLKPTDRLKKLSKYLDKASIEVYSQLEYSELLPFFEKAFTKGNEVFSCDIETTGLTLDKSEIITISFTNESYDSFVVSFHPEFIGSKAESQKEVLVYLFKTLLQPEKGNKLVFHKANFDIPMIISKVFKDSHDGVATFREFDTLEDTMLMAYLLFNSTARTKLSLKDLGSKYIEDYALDDIKNILKVDPHELIAYNVTDTIVTMELYKELLALLMSDPELYNLYRELFIPINIANIRTQLVGFPLNTEAVRDFESTLTSEIEDLMKLITENSFAREVTKLIREESLEKYNQTHKKQKVLEDFNDLEFNPNSTQQLQKLLYEVMNLPVLEETPAKQPKASSKVLTSLKELSDEEDIIEILDALVRFKQAQKIATAFLPQFVKAVKLNPKEPRLKGYFNLCGTVSGRLSSSQPNLQQLPATGTPFAKAVKKLFKAPKGWLLVGLDYNALEATVMALLTKDPARLSVYTDHYDSHCLNAYSYFKEQMPDIRQVDLSTTERFFTFNGEPLSENDYIMFNSKLCQLKDVLNEIEK